MNYLIEMCKNIIVGKTKENQAHRYSWLEDRVVLPQIFITLYQ